MNKIYLLFFCCFISLTAAAATVYYPLTLPAPYSGTSQTVCQNSTNTATNITYTVCHLTTSGTALTATATWYLGGTLVYTDLTPHTIAASGTISLPAAAFTYTVVAPGNYTGTNGLYCVLTWSSSSPSPCTGNDTIQSAPTNIIVNTSPNPITGVAHACTGYTSALIDTVTAGGTPVWSSSNTLVASVAFGTGVVTANAAGTTTIKYTLGSGCNATTVFTVNQTPAAISGTISVCEGSLHTLTDVTAGGIWTSSATSIATIGSSTGSLVAADTVGATTISYTLGTGCATTANVTVNLMPASITGLNAVCSGATITLSDIDTGGVWTSSNTGIASVNFTTGVVTGGTIGNARISYELSSGCYVTTGLITVNPLPAAISGVASVCVGGLASISDATSGGFWTTSNSNAVIGSGSGFITDTGVTAGLDTVYYTLSTGCYKSIVVTVNPLPAAIGGIESVCQGGTTALTDAGGGAWSSSATAIATIATTGVVTGVASGSSTVTYKLSTGCLITAHVTVNALPTAILGTTNLCIGATTTLSDATGGGTWSSSNPGVASIGTGSGVAGGASAGTSTISYTLSTTGCITTKTITVNSLPATISGISSMCAGTNTTLSDITGGGTWSSSNTAVATISAAGLVTAVSAGAVTISYKLSTGCAAEFTLTVNPNPSAITGTTHVCVGSVTVLTDATPSGTWTSTNTVVAQVDLFGNVSGYTAGTTTISYTISATGCYALAPVTVNAIPPAISGHDNVCVGATTSFSDGTAGGTWSVSNATTGSISAAGVLTGLSQGNNIVIYTVTSIGCFISTPVTINPLPAAIIGTPAVCIGLITSLADDTTGGTWSSSNTKAAVDGSGNVTGVAIGTATITYALVTGCQSMINVTVNPIPASINGLSSVCVGSTLSLSDVTAGGAWSSSSTAIATISSTGVVTGTGPGVANITYTLATGCINTTSITVNELPSPIMGIESVCVGLTTSLSNTVSGGIWSSGTTSVATIGVSSGLVTGGSSGISNITYTLGTGCRTMAVVTVDALPLTISGLTNVCIGSIIDLSDLTTGGSWSSSNTSIATIGLGSGIVTGESAGTATITYTAVTGCIRTSTIQVNPLPVGIVGSSDVCIAQTTTLSDPTPGGIWSSGSTTTAIIGTSSGIVTGESAGNVNITYTLSTGCDTMTTITVNPLPAAISGATSVCQGQNITLSDGAFVGTWTSENTTVAIIGSSTGIVTGVAAGTAIITFALNSTGCFKTITITVHPLPSPITGDTIMCQTPTVNLGDPTPAGAWSSSNTGIATITAGGIVTPVAAGTSTISYTLVTGCYITQNITVNPNPSVISGSASICVGSTTGLSDATLGGSWISSNSTFATVNGTTGVVTGVLAGSVTITYQLSTGCIATLPFVVNPLPAAIAGNTFVCIGSNTTLSDASGGGTWNSSNTLVATVSGGVVHGVNTGTTTISYIPTTGCIVTTVITVNSIPSSISGRLYVCTNDTTELGDANSGGEWTSSNTAVATTGTLSGIITGVAQGNATITYTLGTGCYTTSLLTVYPTPVAITGPDNVCEGYNITLSDASTGGIWTSAQTLVATVGATDGDVIAQSVSGPDSIIYTLNGKCSAYKVINVNQTPTITGPVSICTGGDTTLTSSISAGTWTSSNTGIAVVAITTGEVTGVSNGVANISYTLGTGCFASVPATVNPTPSVILGPTNVCPGLSITLSDAVSGGSWTSSNPTVAVINGTTGLVIGEASGSSVISYNITGTGCGVATTINVNPKPQDITGSLSVCKGSTSALSDIDAGGIWISGNPADAPISSSGVVSGVNLGTSNITYELLSTGCITTATVTVNPVPAAISGITNVCTGATITLSDSPALGTWSSSDTSVATVGAITGLVTGVDSGYTTITYTLGTGCFATDLIRGNLSPAPILGSDAVCVGSMITLSDNTTFGTWSSNNTATATINPATGDLMGVSAGATVITYMLGTGCFAYQGVTVNPLPATITGSSIACVGSTIFLGDATAGGAWSIVNPAYGSVDISGNVTGIAPGNDTVVYTLPTGCITTHFITVSPAPSAISGLMTVCSGSVDTLTCTPPGGLWSSSNTLIATVGSGTGYVTGTSAGLVIITYTSLSGCNAVANITVNPVPGVIIGIDNLCPGNSTTLFDTTGGGTWNSTNTAVATIGSTGTVVSILAGSTTTISYTISDGCAATLVFTVDPLPYVGSITGNTTFCMGTTSALGDSVAGGVWSSNNTAVTTIGSGGIATGVSVGTATVSYIVTEQCGMDTATAVVQVSPLPYAAPITGTPELCLHTGTTLTDATLGGVWTSSNTTIATIGSSSGLVYGANSGSVTISYTYTNSCGSYTTSILLNVDAIFTFASIVTFPDTPMCSQTFYQNFGALLPEPSGIVYNWSVTQGDSVIATGINGQYALISFNNPGRAVVTLSAEVTSSGCAIADSFVTTIGSGVSSDPGVKYYLNEFACTDNTQDSYQWGYDDVLTLDSTLLIGETNQTYYNPSPDTLRKNYWVMTTKNGCSQKSYYKFSTTVLGVSNVTASNMEMLLFPNPADSKVNIVVKGLNSTDVVVARLMDMFGKEIKNVSLVDGRGSLQVSELPSGVYSVIILSNDTMIGAKIFVKD